MKKQELKDMTEQELAFNLEESQKALFGCEIRHRTTPLKNTMEIRTLRRHIARIKTILRERLNKKGQGAGNGSQHAIHPVDRSSSRHKT